jgi:S1-C subfamily serine protease
MKLSGIRIPSTTEISLGNALCGLSTQVMSFSEPSPKATPKKHKGGRNSVFWRLFALMFMMLFVASCAYHGSMEVGFYKPEQDGEIKKIPVTVAYFPDKLPPFSAHGDLGDSYTIETNDALHAGITCMLDSVFEKCIAFSEISDAQEVSFLIKPKFKSRTIYRNSFNGNMQFKAQLTLDISSYPNNELIRSYSHEGIIYYENPGAATFLNILTGASLGLLSPITIPAIVQVAGEEGCRLTEEKMPEFMDAIKQDILLDEKKLVFSSAATIIDAPTSGQKQEKSEIPSQYDDFLNCVVVVRSSGGIGTGFFVSQDGKIITNWHVVANEKNVSVKLRKGVTRMASVVSVDKTRDLALLKLTGENYSYLELATEKEMGLGSDVLAIGTPEGLEWSVSRGIISAVRRNKNGIRLVQTDSAINHGNSGGPLISLSSGSVVGVNTFGARKDVAEGLNFAVGADEIKKAFPTEIK